MFVWCNMLHCTDAFARYVALSAHIGIDEDEYRDLLALTGILNGCRTSIGGILRLLDISSVNVMRDPVPTREQRVKMPTPHYP